MVRDGRAEQKGESGSVDGDRHGRRTREMEMLIRLDDADWSEHVMRDGHGTTPQ